MITSLPPLATGDPVDRPSGLGADHPMRVITRRVAFEPDGWNAETRNKVRALFDGLAPDWNSRDVAGRSAPLIDALDRGLASGPGGPRRLAVDIGSGTGLGSGLIAAQFETTSSVDLSAEMLRQAPPEPALRVQGDASSLPLLAGSADALVLSNAFLFSSEVERVLAPKGTLIWVNSRGIDTPIHLTADEVDAALPGDWQGVASAAGWGTWSVHWRDGSTCT